MRSVSKCATDASTHRRSFLHGSGEVSARLRGQSRVRFLRVTDAEMFASADDVPEREPLRVCPGLSRPGGTLSPWIWNSCPSNRNRRPWSTSRHSSAPERPSGPTRMRDGCCDQRGRRRIRAPSNTGGGCSGTLPTEDWGARSPSARSRWNARSSGRRRPTSTRFPARPCRVQSPWRSRARIAAPPRVRRGGAGH